MSRTVLIVTDEPLGERMPGLAVRAWRMAEHLANDHDVTLLSMTGAEREAPSFRVTDRTREPVLDAVRSADVTIYQAGSLLEAEPSLRDSDDLLVVDLYDPVLLEELEAARADPFAASEADIPRTVRLMRTHLLRADAILCASERQRRFWIGHLAALGRLDTDYYPTDPGLRRRIAIVPIGVDESPPERTGVLRKTLGIPPDDVVILWGGGLHSWYDPLTLIRAVADVAADAPRLRLVFLSSAHPDPRSPRTAMAVEAERLAGELGVLGGAVLFNEHWIPHSERGGWFADADLGTSISETTLENEFSFRTRMLDYLWAGLPIITTEGDSFGELVHERGLGAAVEPGDPGALAAAIRRLLDPLARAQARVRCEAVRAEFAWPHVLARLTELVDEIDAAPRAPFADTDELAARVRELESSTSWRVTAPLRRITSAVSGLRKR